MPSSTSSKVRYWTCGRCGTRNPRIAQQCLGEHPPGSLVRCPERRPKPRVPVHARTLRDDPYQTYLDITEQIDDKADENPPGVTLYAYEFVEQGDDE